MRAIRADNQREVEINAENFILIVAADTPEGEQCLQEMYNADMARAAAVRKYLNAVRAKRAARLNGTPARIDNQT